jgi:hypothetical protein
MGSFFFALGMLAIVEITREEKAIMKLRRRREERLSNPIIEPDKTDPDWWKNGGPDSQK